MGNSEKAPWGRSSVHPSPGPGGMLPSRKGGKLLVGELEAGIWTRVTREPCSDALVWTPLSGSYGDADHRQAALRGQRWDGKGGRTSGPNCIDGSTLENGGYLK